MRRFLVHLLIIIFLGLKFTVSVKAQDNSDAICIEPVKQKYGSDDLVTGLYWVTKKFIKYHGYSQKLNSPICNTYEITKNQYPNTFNKFISKYQWATGVISLTTNEIIEFTKQDQIFTQEKNQLIPNKNFKIAKVKINTNFNTNNFEYYAIEYPNINTMKDIYNSTTFNQYEAILFLKDGKCKFGSRLEKLVEHLNFESSFDLKCRYSVSSTNNITAKIADKINISIYPKELKVKGKFKSKIVRVADSNEIFSLAKKYKVSKILNKSDKNKIQTAKAEPSQTQKVANKEIKFCVNEVSPYYTSVDGHKYKIRRFDNPYINCNSDFIIDDNYKDDLFYAYLVETVGIVDTRRFSKLKPPVFWKPKNPIKPKKKVKVAKKEEFKPDNKDNEAPVIEIAEAITVNDSTYEIEGKVIDKSKKLFVQIDGETIPVRNGKFKVTRFSPVDEQLKIVAIDQWGNKSKPKLVNITIDIKGTELVEKLEQLNPSLIKSKPNKNRVALIIGIEKYEQTPDANFANLDAQYFYEYARKGFGISKANINLLVDEDASLIKSISTINKWLPSKIKKNQTELIIFFAGHGLASNDGKELYLLPQDSDPDLLSRTALSRTELFEQIIKLSPKSVTMFMDTCYSGISRDEKMLLASARPIRIVASDKDGIPDNFTIFSASRLDQISSGLKEAEHGIFSYFLMKGLEGKADLNKDKEITNGELLAYMDQNVSQKASELGRQQNPSLAGDPDKVLMSYR